MCRKLTTNIPRAIRWHATAALSRSERPSRSHPTALARPATTALAEDLEIAGADQMAAGAAPGPHVHTESGVSIPERTAPNLRARREASNGRPQHEAVPRDYLVDEDGNRRRPSPHAEAEDRHESPDTTSGEIETRTTGFPLVSRTTGSESVLKHWRSHKGEVIISALIALIAVAVTLFGTGRLPGDARKSTPAPPAEIFTLDSLREYLLAQPDWQGTPTTFAAMLNITLEDQATAQTPALVSLNTDGTEVDAY